MNTTYVVSLCVLNDKSRVGPNHSRFAKKHINPPQPRRKFFYGDFETNMSSSNIHYPIGAVAVDEEGMARKFVGYDAGDEFCE